MEIQQHDSVVVEVAGNLGRASPSTTEEEEVLEEGEGCARGRVRLPSLSLTIYRGREEGEGRRDALGEGRRPQGKP